MTITAAFVSGLIVAGFSLAGLFLLAFWRRTRDWFFLALAAAFWLMAANQTLTALLGIPREEQSWIYSLRLAAFVIILAGVIAKNFAPQRRRPAAPNAERERRR